MPVKMTILTLKIMYCPHFFLKIGLYVFLWGASQRRFQPAMYVLKENDETKVIYLT